VKPAARPNAKKIALTLIWALRRSDEFWGSDGTVYLLRRPGNYFKV